MLLPISMLLKRHDQEMVETLATFCLYQTMDLESQVNRKLWMWKVWKETNPKTNSWKWMVFDLYSFLQCSILRLLVGLDFHSLCNVSDYHKLMNLFPGSLNMFYLAITA